MNKLGLQHNGVLQAASIVYLRSILQNSKAVLWQPATMCEEIVTMPANITNMENHMILCVCVHVCVCVCVCVCVFAFLCVCAHLFSQQTQDGGRGSKRTTLQKDKIFFPHWHI